MKRMVLVAVLTVGALGAVWLAVAGGAAGALSTAKVTAAARLPSGAKAIGAVPATTNEKGALVLRPRDEAALQQFIGAVTDPQSPQFHQYLAPGAFAARFGPSQARRRGHARRSVGRPARHRRRQRRAGRALHGSAERGRARLSHRLERYGWPTGATARRRRRAVRLRRRSRDSVTAVLGLNELAHPQAPALVRAPRVGARPPSRGQTS